MPNRSSVYVIFFIFVKVNPSSIYKTCVNMVCKQSDMASKEAVVCDMLEVLGERCTCNGIAVAWKSEYLCRKWLRTKFA